MYTFHICDEVCLKVTAANSIKITLADCFIELPSDYVLQILKSKNIELPTNEVQWQSFIDIVYYDLGEPIFLSDLEEDYIEFISEIFDDL